MSLVNDVDIWVKTPHIFFDFSETFDTISLNILYDKLDNIVIKGITLDLFKSYLADRI